MHQHTQVSHGQQAAHAHDAAMDGTQRNWWKGWGGGQDAQANDDPPWRHASRAPHLTDRERQERWPVG